MFRTTSTSRSIIIFRVDEMTRWCAQLAIMNERRVRDKLQNNDDNHSSNERRERTSRLVAMRTIGVCLSTSVNFQVSEHCASLVCAISFYNDEKRSKRRNKTVRTRQIVISVRTWQVTTNVLIEFATSKNQFFFFFSLTALTMDSQPQSAINSRWAAIFKTKIVLLAITESILVRLIWKIDFSATRSSWNVRVWQLTALSNN